MQQYFTPSVLVLLLQHLAITFASLSIIREFREGTMEVFHVSPLLNGGMLMGKYLGYLFAGALTAAALTLLFIYTLGIPLLGSWIQYAAVTTALLICSLGIGFLISIFSETESQAIQFSMIVLLLSIFFTGFLLNLHLLWPPVRTISWLLPATYGIRLLQDVMLRGISVNAALLAILAAAGMALFFVCTALLGPQSSSAIAINRVVTDLKLCARSNHTCAIVFQPFRVASV